MNKYLYYENEVCDLIKKLNEKYRSSIQLVDNLPANACVVNYENKYIIFVSNKLDKKLLPLTILHEFGHIYFNTIRSNPKKHNYFIELLSNLYAINKLLFIFPIYKRIILFLLSIFSEKKLYKYYIKNTCIGGKKLYEQILENKW